jgi:hypothetical protein
VPSTLRGYNGVLVIGNEGVHIRRGLRGRLTRKRRDPDVWIPFAEVTAVRFAPSGWLVGYLEVVVRGASTPSSGYLTTIRDPHTVTFLTRPGRWRRAAEELASLSGVVVEVEPAAPYRQTIFGAASPRRQTPRRQRLRRFLIWMPVRLAILVAGVASTRALGLPDSVGLVLVAFAFAATAILQHRAPK